MPAGYKSVIIDKYSVSHYVVPGKYCVNSIWFRSGGSTVGSVTFVPKGIASPQSKVNETPFAFDLYYDGDIYPDIIETLRYEKPINVFVSWDASDVVKAAVIRSGDEPIGEQEGQGAPFMP
jgi:hypothetical protein